MVIGILLVLVSLAIPSLSAARRAANHGAAAAAMHTLVVAQATYQESYPAVGYSNLLANLGPPAATGCPTPAIASACIIDWTLAGASAGGITGSRGGYVFYVGADDGGSGSGVMIEFVVSGAPISTTIGTKAFCAIEDGVVRVNDSATITAPSTTRDDCINNYVPLQ